MNHYYLTVYYKAKPGMAKAFVNALEEQGVASAVRAEEGCVHYDYYYSAKDSDVIFLFEEWETKRHQEIHLTQPHIATLLAIKDQYVEESRLVVLD